MRMERREREGQINQSSQSINHSIAIVLINESKERRREERRRERRGEKRE